MKNKNYIKLCERIIDFFLKLPCKLGIHAYEPMPVYMYELIDKDVWCIKCGYAKKLKGGSK
jgi:hypothetical protein